MEQQLHERRQRLNRLQQEQEHDELEDLLPSPSPSSSSPISATPDQLRQPSAPRRTVSTLPGEKTCWICYETSLESPNRPFVHPCACTLLSHPDCLLEWISTRNNTASSSTPRCPVCATLIIVKEDKSRYLVHYRDFRRKLDKLSMAASVAGVAGSAWLVASAYGLWAVRVFMGDQVTRALLERNQKGIPFRLWLNLPLIPFALILSRTPLIDSLLPFLPLTLALSSHGPHTLSLPSLDPLGLDDLTLHYPPSPTLTICLLPWLRILYCRARVAVFRRVLGKQKRFRGLAGMMEEAARDEQASWEILERDQEGGEGQEGRRERNEPRSGIELVAELEYEIHEEDHDHDQQHPEGAPRRQQEPGQQQQQRQPVRQQQEQEEDETRLPSSLRIGIGRLTSLLLGALIYPALSSLVGSALFYLATRSSSSSSRPASLPLKTLRKILGISSLIASSSSSKNPLQTLFNPFSAILGVTSRTGTKVDPVWIRNTIGGGIVLLLRDAFELSAGVLEKRRKESRRVVERPVGEGLSLRSEAEEGGGVSGGRNSGGREARVHVDM